MQKLLKKLNALQIGVAIKDGNLDIKAPKGAMTSELFSELKKQKEELIVFLKEYQTKEDQSSITLAEPKPYYALSSSQYKLWLLQEIESGNTAYNMPSAFNVSGDLQVPLIKEAFHYLIKRHEILRTNFKWDVKTKNPVQFVRPFEEIDFVFSEIDLSNTPSKEQRLLDIAQEESEHVFDLSEECLFRVMIVKTAPLQHTMIFVLHHIVSDGWSSGVIIKDVYEIYNSLLEKKEIELDPLSIQYKDYAEWQQNLLEQEAMELHKKYWTSKYSNSTTSLEIPTSYTRPPVKTYNGATHSKTYAKRFFEELCNAQESTLFMGLTALVNTLFYKYTGSTQSTLGTPISGRSDAVLMNQIGFFVNILAIRTSFEEENSFTDLLSKVKKSSLEAFEHQAYPFDALINELGISDRSRHPLFDIVVSTATEDNDLFPSGEALEVTQFELNESTSKFDLEFVFVVKSNEITLKLTYNTDLYECDFIRQMANHLEEMMANVIDNPDASIKHLNYIPEAEKEKIQVDFRGLVKSISHRGTFNQVFEENLVDIENLDAVVYENQIYTYKTINEEANKLANYLIDHFDVEPNDFVGVRLQRSKNFIVAFLAIQKTGGVYVPIDSSYPQERITFIEEDSQSKCIIDDAFLETYEVSKYTKTTNVVVEKKPEDLAYMIYTSGSTGKPKGVMITHENLLNICYWHISYYEVASSSNATIYAGISFDASLLEFCPYLLIGATLFPISDDIIRLDMPSLVDFLKSNRITHSYFPTAICQELVIRNTSMTNIKVLAGGEALKIQENPKFDLYNNYGPTEYTIVTTAGKVKKNDKIPITIGKPIWNTQVHILNKDFEIVPIGIPGEIFISGAGIAKGYWNRPILSAEKFIDNPFEPGTKMYATGDLGKWLPNGEMLFLGRKDFQIKLRGYRIELGEIEHAIANFSNDVNQVTVIVQKDHIIAYYTQEKPVSTEKLASYLQKNLPSFMVPSHLISIEDLPLTPNGKIDRKYLESLPIHQLEKKEYIAPTNEVEQKLVTIWEELLGIKDISIVDDFFTLGGHSILLMKLMAKYQEEFKISLSLAALYQHTNLQSHARLLAQESHTTIEIPKLEDQNDYELSSTQLRYWLIDKVKGRSKEFNICNTFQLPLDLDDRILEVALSKLIERHETLRTIFLANAGIPRQKILSNSDFDIHFCASDDEAENYAFDHVFDLNIYPLFRISVAKTESQNNLYFNIHHSICDGWSIQTLYKDLLILYKAEKEKLEANLPKLSIQYKEYASWQSASLNSDGLTYQKEYWLDQLQPPFDYLKLPIDFPETIKSSASSYGVSISEALQKKIIKISQKENVSLFSFFLAVFKVLIYKITYNVDSIVGIPVANRNHYQVQDLAGCFLNTVMLRDRVDQELHFDKWLQLVNQTLTDGLINQNYPFELILEALKISQVEDKFPLSPVFINMVDFDNATEELCSNDSQFEVLDVPPKFDLECYIKSYTNGFTIDCIFDDQLFSRETICLWIDAFVNGIDKFTDDVTLSLKDISIFSEIKPEPQLYPENDFLYFEDEEVNQSIISRFEKQVVKYGDKPAVVAYDTSFTYREINDWSNQLSEEINFKSKEQNTNRIALLLSHDESCVIGMLGSLKSGRAYVPIDLENPIHRIQFILEDSQCGILICDYLTHEKAHLLQQEKPDLVIIKLDKERKILNIPNPKSSFKPTDEAYVLYTSGSTGNPKGVIQLQKNVLHYIRVYTNNVSISERDNLSVFSTYSFDASVKDIYGAILNGATVSLYHVAQKGLSTLADWLRQQEISIIHMVPTIYRYFTSILNENEILETVRLVDLGGEASYKSDFELFKKHFPVTSFLVNDYGPTEATIVSQHFLNHKSKVGKHNLHLGSAVAETEVFLLDEDGRTLGVYEEGEISFRSEYLSLGYLNLEERTSLVFYQDESDPKKRIYKSGDLGKLLPNGAIEFLGRKDSQIKLNGLRIELSEIEFQIEQSPGINKAIVTLQSLEDNQYITCHYLGYSMDVDLFNKKLKDRLPSYMIPKIYIQVSEFPQTRTGKIDRKALPKPELSDLKTKEYLAPQNDLEKQLVEIWSEHLSVSASNLGVLDNFFEIGGNSLQAVIVINTINKKFDAAISIENLYETQNIKDLAGVINFSLLQKVDEKENPDDREEIIL